MHNKKIPHASILVLNTGTNRSPLHLLFPSPWRLVNGLDYYMYTYKTPGYRAAAVLIMLLSCKLHYNSSEVRYRVNV